MQLSQQQVLCGVSALQLHLHVRLLRLHLLVLTLHLLVLSLHELLDEIKP